MSRDGAVAVRAARWACVTAGEFDQRTRVVVVNETVVDRVAARRGCAAAEVRAAIVAHELAHAADGGLALSRPQAEARARAAAVAAAGEAIVLAIDDVLRMGRDADRTGH